jgi:histidinol phosphatase-like PHP family hydrolase
VVDAAIKFNVALEIDCQFRVPSLRFLQTAKSAGVVFAFGSNFQTAEKLGDISYCVDCYKRLGLTPKQFFCPAAPGLRAVDRR